MPKAAAKKRFGELSNARIDQLFRGVKQFLGCFSKDQLPSADDTRGHFFIVNLQDHDKGPGSHWTMLYAVGRTPFYFDSMGQVPPKSVHRLMKELNGSSVRGAGHYNRIEVQEYDSVTCGYFCVYVARRLLSGLDPRQVMHAFNPHNFAANEAMVKSHF